MKTVSKKITTLFLTVLMLITPVTILNISGFEAYATTYKKGDIVCFGSYPQSKVNDSELISALNNKAPEWEEWTNYGYYCGNGNYDSMVQGDWMRYIDVIYNNEKYRGVKFTQYRPRSAIYPSSTDNSNQYDNGYSLNTTHWFKFEKIEWKVIDPASGFVISNLVIDAQPYSNTLYKNGGGIYGYFNDTSYTNYANDYVTSSIRKWLNDDFFNTAFTDSEKTQIQTTTLNNGGYYTSIGNNNYKEFDSDETNDKIFLLSYKEATDGDSGRLYSYLSNANSSDYAYSQGQKRGWEHLRSPGDYSDFSCQVKPYNITNHFNCGVSFTLGIRPALKFNDLHSIDQTEHNHYYTSTINKYPSHIESGEMIYKCSCGDICNEKIAKLKNHTYKSEITAPTCTEKGYTTYTCECGDSYVADYITENGHKHTSEITTPATHLTEGVKTFTCTCGDTYTETIEKIAKHDYKAVVTAPTCTEQGYTTYTCECGDSYVADYIAENGHKHELEITTPATHTSTGVMTYTCHCGDTYADVIDKIAEHNYKAVVTAPTCTEQGYTTYTCECGDSYVADYVDENGHKHESAVTTPATHTSTGVMTYTCHCGDTYADVIDKIAEHNYKAVVTKPTCTEKGYTTCTCECGDTYISNYKGATGHDYDSSIVTTKPNCTKTGIKTFTCANCGDTYPEEVKALGHSYASVVTKPATHLKTGVMTYSCDCGDTYTETIDKIAEHNYKSVVTAPTCTEQGYTTYTCECGDSYVADYVDETGHSEGDSDGNCTVCGEHICDHDCHKSGIAGFFWKIVCFFSKLFGSNKFCECGAAHY